MRHGLLLAFVALLSGTACAKENACEVPADLPHPMLEGPTRDQPRRLLPIGGYTLALSWSPERCANRMTNPRDQTQCSGKMGNFGFTLHGLWPEGEGGSWPQYCAPTRLVPEKVIRENLCSTPSVQLIQHEWEKHGSCMSRTPAEYFTTSGALFAAMRFPDMKEFSGRTASIGAVSKAFAGANEGMRPDQLRLKVSRDGWLEEIWVCLDKKFARTNCPAHQRSAASGRIVKIR